MVSHVEREGGYFWLQRELGAAEDISANLDTGKLAALSYCFYMFIILQVLNEHVEFRLEPTWWGGGREAGTGGR